METRNHSPCILVSSSFAASDNSFQVESGCLTIDLGTDVISPEVIYFPAIRRRQSADREFTMLNFLVVCPHRSLLFRHGQVPKANLNRTDTYPHPRKLSVTLPAAPKLRRLTPLSISIIPYPPRRLTTT